MFAPVPCCSRSGQFRGSLPLLYPYNFDFLTLGDGAHERDLEIGNDSRNFRSYRGA